MRINFLRHEFPILIPKRIAGKPEAKIILAMQDFGQQAYEALAHRLTKGKDGSAQRRGGGGWDWDHRFT